MKTVTTNDTRFTLNEDETLLEALERTGHDIEYQCRSGYCGSCRVRMISGSVRYDSAPLAFMMPDEILPCCCRVENSITVDCNLRTEAQDDLFYPDLFDGGKQQ